MAIKGDPNIKGVARVVALKAELEQAGALRPDGSWNMGVIQKFKPAYSDVEINAAVDAIRVEMRVKQQETDPSPRNFPRVSRYPHDA